MARFLVLEQTITCSASIHRTPIRNAALANQLRRAADSIALNLAEGSGRRGRDRKQFYRIAYGSCLEAQTAVKIILDAGLADAHLARQWLNELDSIGAQLWKLQA